MKLGQRRVLRYTLALCLAVLAAPFAAFGIGAEAAGAVEVPREAMVIANGTYYGISKEWFAAYNPSGEKLFLALQLPSGVTEICKDGLRDSWSSEKQRQGCITNYNYDGDKTYTDKYEIVSVDFTRAKDLITIGEQAALGGALTGVLDLSDTRVETIGKNAFKNCTGLEGVILPPTLRQIGSTSSGSVFYGCSGLQFVRVAGEEAAVFALPKSLEVIGNQSFYGCTGLPAGTQITIPASVTHVGSEAFNYTPSITTITVQAKDASGYHAKAFSISNHSYGLGNRLTVFSNAAAKNTFSPSGLTAYKNSITYTFTLHYGQEEHAVTQPKLYGQPVDVCKAADGTWAKDADYQIPQAPGEPAPVGYDCGWEYDGKILTRQTVLKPEGDDLYLNAAYVLQNPTVEFIVDNEIFTAQDTYLKLNLSNDTEHTIGVAVSHPIQTAQDADVRVKFEYAWTDVFRGGSEGPRMQEPGFGRYNLWDNPNVTNTITVHGPEHERTSAGSYSGTDYGDGYYLLEIYGYYVPKAGGQWQLFYKSASTVMGSDPQRTVDTAYLFDVITSDPVQAPEVGLQDVWVSYGYDGAELKADVAAQPGTTYAYQWYEAAGEGQQAGGSRIEGATGAAYPVPAGKDAGAYHYYVEVTATKAENGDAKKVAVPATLTVAPKAVTVTPAAGQGKYAGQSDGDLRYALSEEIDVQGALGREPGEAPGSYGFTLGTLAATSGNYALQLQENDARFTIERYLAQAIFSPEQPDGENGWYRTAVTVTPPEGHSISLDEGRTWHTGPVVLEEYDGEFSYLLRSEREDDTKGAIACNAAPLSIDTVAPVICGLEDGKTYCEEIGFFAFDEHLSHVTVNGVRTERTTLKADGSTYTVIAFDRAGNQSASYTVTVKCPPAAADVPQTGDANGTAGWIALLAAGCCALAASRALRKRAGAKR